jgi:hypothetical protein
MRNPAPIVSLLATAALAACGGSTTTPGPDASTSTGLDASSSCVQTGSTCSTTPDCCKGTCLYDDKKCHDPCTVDSDCSSACCAPIAGGTAACVAASYCCKTNSDCATNCCISVSTGGKNCASASHCP